MTSKKNKVHTSPSLKSEKMAITKIYQITYDLKKEVYTLLSHNKPYYTKTKHVSETKVYTNTHKSHFIMSTNVQFKHFLK
jgi:hypothetical protein